MACGCRPVRRFPVRSESGRTSRRVRRRSGRTPMEGRKALSLCFERRKPRLLLLVEIRSAVDGRPEELDDPSRRLRIERTERRSALQRRRAVRVGRRLQGRQVLPLLQYARCDRRGRGRGRRSGRSVPRRPARRGNLADRSGRFHRRRRAGLSLLGTVLGQGRQAEGQYARGRHGRRSSTGS